MERALRYFAWVTSLLVIAGFVAFATDQFQSASQRTQDEIAGVHDASPTVSQEQLREKQHTRVREWIDDANDVLLAPFAWMSDGSRHIWVRRGVPTLLALLLYGFGLCMVARFSHGSARHHRPHASPV